VDNLSAVDSWGRLSDFAGMLRDFGRPERVYSVNGDFARIIAPHWVIPGDRRGASTNGGGVSTGASTDRTRAVNGFVSAATEFGPAPIEFDRPEFGSPLAEFGRPAVESGH
jgi:hypothetical protein